MVAAESVGTVLECGGDGTGLGFVWIAIDRASSLDIVNVADGLDAPPGGTIR